MNNKKRLPSRTSTLSILDNFKEWLHLEVAEGDPSPNTVRAYLSNSRVFLSWCNSEGINTLTASTDDIKRYRAHLVMSGYRRGSISTILAGISQYFEALKSWGWREDNPVLTVKAKRELTSRSERIIAKYIPDRDIFLGLYHLPNSNSLAGKRDRAVLRILCFTGIRVCELCSLNIEDLDLCETPSLTILAGKGKKRRQIPLDQTDLSILRMWLDARNAFTDLNEDALFISLDNRTRGTRLSTRSARRIVDKYLTMAGIKQEGRSCHALRHSTATWLLAAGVPMEVIADLLGHSSVSVTAVYAKAINHRKYIPGTLLTKQLREMLKSYNAHLVFDHRPSVSY